VTSLWEQTVIAVFSCAASTSTANEVLNEK